MNRNGNPHRIVKLRVRGWKADHIHRTAYLMVPWLSLNPCCVNGALSVFLLSRDHAHIMIPSWALPGV